MGNCTNLGTTATGLAAASRGSALLGLLLLGRSTLLTLLLGGLRANLAGKLNANLTLNDLLATQLGDGTLGLLLGVEVDESVPNGTASARVGRDGGRLTTNMAG